MAEEYRCDICGKGPFKTPQALSGHKRFAHEKAAGTVKEETEKVVPDVVNDFELLLKDYGIKKAALIAKHLLILVARRRDRATGAKAFLR